MRVLIEFHGAADTETYRSVVSALSVFARETTGEGISVLGGPDEVSVRVPNGEIKPISDILGRHNLALTDAREGKDMLGRAATVYRLVLKG